MQRLAFLALPAALVGLGCESVPGPIDEDLAHEVVYDAQGTPAFAGQALMIQSCGAGSYCHTEGVPTEEVLPTEEHPRFGAPVGLDFDVRPAAIGIDDELERSERLAQQHANVLANAGSIWSQTQSGSMPPGEVGRAYLGADEVTSLRFDRFADDGRSFTRLPPLFALAGEPPVATLDPDALEIFRNWLASGAPVVERVLRRRDATASNLVGETVPTCARTCVDPTWPAIYEEIIAPTCAFSRCHDAEDPTARLDFSGGAVAAHAQLYDAEARGSSCRPEGIPRLTAGDLDRSLFYLKLAAVSSDEVCGGVMPQTGNHLTENRLCTIREWINCGACVDELDPRCNAACLAAARVTCGIDPSAESGCVVDPVCSNRPPS